MDVSVHSKHGHRFLRAVHRPSLLGGGLLERARSTTFALLGVTAAVGLAMVALALNQSWPLVAGSAIPAPLGHAGIGKATAVAGTLPGRSGSGGEGGEPQPHRQAQAPASRSGGSTEPAPPAGATDFVLSPSTPVSSQGGGKSHNAPKSSPPPPQQPEQVGEAPATQTSPAPAPAPSPSSTPVAVAAETTVPPPTSAEAPGEEEESESDDPSEGDEGDDGEDEGWGGSWHGHGHGDSHGHHWGS
jgi:hypothetical protein